jgi:hypothetical protein
MVLSYILRTAGVEFKYGKPITAQNDGASHLKEYIRMAQPYGAFAKALFEIQHYPDLRDATGHPIAPYDVTAHTLPLLLDVAVMPMYSPIRYKSVTIDDPGELESSKDPVGLAIYKSHVPTNDEGWTRWVIEQNGNTLPGHPASKQLRNTLPFTSIEDHDTRAGSLHSKYQTIIIPDQPRLAILNGYRAGTMPPEYTGGIGEKGVKALREFVEDGGTLVCLNRASDFAIEQFKLPLRDVVAGLPRTDFYVPGSILRIELDTSNPIARDMPNESIAWAEDSPAFEVTSGTGVPPVGVRVTRANTGETPVPQVHVIAWYPKDKDPLLSGWLLGGDRIKGKAALVEVELGKGRIVLFGFRPQYRGQSLATYPLFFNAIR